MRRPIALLTPTHRKDIERFALLCDSIDQRLTGHDRHYVIVNDDDMPQFAPFVGDRRVIMPCSRFLPSWLRLAPSFLLRNGRRVWWSFHARPVHGWHIQQILKIAAVLQLPEQRFCIIDSDNVLIRPFDIAAYAGGERTPLYVEPAAIEADAPLHANWIRNCDRLLGHEATSFPADDHIGNMIVWDKDAVRAMTQAMTRATGKDWALALCQTRAFSEYLLYGRFVGNSPEHLTSHEPTTESLAVAHWDATPLDRNGVIAMIDAAPRSKAALCIESFSHTPVDAIREAVGLGQPNASRTTLHAA